MPESLVGDLLEAAEMVNLWDRHSEGPHILLAVARIHDVEDTIDGERSFCYVCGNHALPGAWWSRLEDLGLDLAGLGAIHWQDFELGNVPAQLLHSVREDLPGGVDLL